MATGKAPEHFTTLTDFARRHTSGLTSWIGRRLWALGVHPDLITLVGTVIVAGAAVAAAYGHLFWAALILIAGMPLDALDGAVARAMQRTDRFGALWDSTLDRYSDGFIFTGLAVYFSRQGHETGMLLALAAMLGSVLVSYVRARAEGLNVDCKVGLFTRLERVILLLAMLVTGWLVPGLWIMAIGTHITVAQRVWHVYRTLKESGAPIP